MPQDGPKKKLLLEVYMETKCPDTELFVANQLEPAMKVLGDYVDLILYPYGKADVSFNSLFHEFFNEFSLQLFHIFI